MTFFASSWPITYSSRCSLISLGLISFSAVCKLLFLRWLSSSLRISPAWVIQRSQMYASSPAISIRASFFVIPQKEQVCSFVYFHIFLVLSVFRLFATSFFRLLFFFFSMSQYLVYHSV